MENKNSSPATPALPTVSSLTDIAWWLKWAIEHRWYWELSTSIPQLKRELDIIITKLWTLIEK